MKIGFRTAGFHEWPIGGALKALGDLGYDGVEICLEHPDCRPEKLTGLDALDLARMCSDAGLEVASVSYHADFELPQLRLQNTLAASHLVPALGADVFIINGRRLEPGVEDEARTELTITLLMLLLNAEEEGVRVAIEPEPGLAVGSSAEMKALVDRTGAPHLGVNLDVGHAFLTDRDVCASIQMLGTSIFHTHFEGMAAGVHKHLLPGEGDLDLVAVCRALTEIGYAGYCTIDLFSIGDDPVRWAASALDAMRGIIAEADTCG